MRAERIRGAELEVVVVQSTDVDAARMRKTRRIFPPDITASLPGTITVSSYTGRYSIREEFLTKGFGIDPFYADRLRGPTKLAPRT